MLQSGLRSGLQSTWTIRKRTLGLTLVALAILAALGILGLDMIRSDHTGIGPAQKLALAGCGGLALLGLSVVLLGVDPDQPAAAPERVAANWPQPAPWLRRVLLGIAAVLLAFHLVVYVVYAISLTQFPFDYDQG